ncbi:hypothetical protein [uncultured Sulfitobacter sp.]|uniref:hypothetical protein n=1 Tax=uncultured Sulfitobacter sp. TaxID=191468 RepID=UPI0030FAF48E
MKYKKIALLICFVAFASPLSAETCDISVAEGKLQKAEAAGIISGVGFFNDKPTIAVERQTWDAIRLDARLGMIETLECAIAGPGNILAEVQIIDLGGLVLATFDGVDRQLQVAE